MDKVKELERLEERELEVVKKILLEDDRSWEQRKGLARSESARNSLELQSSVKRQGAKQGAGRRKKYDVGEDDWGAMMKEKTTSVGKSGRSLGAKRSVNGGEEPEGAAQVNQPKDGPFEQPEGGSVQATTELPPPPQSLPQTPMVEDGLVLGNTNQLHSLCFCSKTSIKEYFQHMRKMQK